jgi:hypothetical protein
VRAALLLDEDHPGRARLHGKAGVSDEEALAKGMAEKVKEFVAQAAEIYCRAPERRRHR